MLKISRITGAGVAAVAVGVSLISGATAATASPGGNHHNQDRHGDQVTGAVAQQAIDAALAVVPGTADHVHATADGGYRVKVQTAEGKTIIVTLDAAFAVTGQQQMRGKVVITQTQRTSASEAALAAVPDGTVLQVRADRDGGFRVLVRTSDGVKKLVSLDTTYAVTSVQDATKHQGRGKGRHSKGTEVTGQAYTKAEAAALTAVPSGTVVDVHQRGNGYHVLVKKADGSTVCVRLNADFQVTDTASFRLKTAA